MENNNKKSNKVCMVVGLIILAGIAVFVFTNQKSQVPEVPVPLEQAAGVAPTVKEFTVSGTNFAFEPSTITVNKGDNVRIVFKNTQGFHDWKIDEFGAATKQTGAPTEEVLEFVADKAGTFEYYCSVGQHRAMGMKGTLVVSE